MKRFFCTVCEKIKYVNKFPVGIEDPKNTDPSRRLGQCKWHQDKEMGMTHVESIGSKRVRHKISGIHKISATQQKQKSKK